jgi:hypothetical protein
MSQEQRDGRPPRLSRRGALRAGATVGAMGAGLAMGAGGPALGGASPARAQGAAWRTEQIEAEFTPVNPTSIVRAGSGPPQRGDWFYTDGPIFATGDVGGQPIGVYQCFGAWTRAGTDTDSPDQRLTSVQFHLFGRGRIMGLINEGGADQPSIVGAVQGGTDAFTGALGTFRQVGPPAGVVAQPLVVRAIIDLLLPNPGP